MKRLSKALGAVLLLLVATAALLFVNIWCFKPITIDAFYGRVFGKFALDRPQLLSELRALPPWLDFYSDKLDDASPAQDRRDAELTRDGLDTLRRYDRSAIDPERRLSYDTLEYFLRMKVEGERFREYNFPVNQLSGEQIELPNFIARAHQVKTVGEGDAYVARLNKVPVKFAQLLASLRLREGKGILPPRFVLDKVIVQMQGFVAMPAAEHPLYVDLKRVASSNVPPRRPVGGGQRPMQRVN